MKALGAVRHQIKQVSFRHLKKRLEVGLRPRPANCVHNRAMQHPDIIAAQKGSCGVCVCPKQEGDVLCDPAWGGVAKAKSCGFFEPIVDKKTLKAGFKAWLSTAQLHEVAAEYPDLAALLWVLQDEAPNREVEISDDEDWEPDEDTEEVFEIEIEGVTVQVSDPEAVATIQEFLANVTISAATFAVVNGTVEGLQADKRQALTDLEAEQATTTQLTTDLATEESTTAQLRAELEAKNTVYMETTDQLADVLREYEELQSELNAKSKLPAPRLSWWTRWFGGPQ